jgi:hypothetical protein
MCFVAYARALSEATTTARGYGRDLLRSLAHWAGRVAPQNRLHCCCLLRLLGLVLGGPGFARRAFACAWWAYTHSPTAAATTSNMAITITTRIHYHWIAGAIAALYAVAPHGGGTILRRVCSTIDFR